MPELEVDNKICEYRKALGLSQHKLAKKAFNYGL